jgi:radical SAM protein with 4Fe4S-binding SPASM domain
VFIYGLVVSMEETVSDKIGIFLAVECSLGNPVSRFVVNSLSKKKNGKSLLEEALMVYCNLDSPPLLEKLKTLPLCAMLGLGRTAFGADKNTLREYFSDPIARRGLINVMRSIGKYGVTRPFKLAAPFLVVWNYTNACNLNCHHCYQKAKKPLPDELSTDEKLRIVKELADNDVVALAFSGGEPLLSPDFFEVAAYASEHHMYVSLATNGTLLTKQTVNRIVESGVGYVEISLDAATPEAHDNFRGRKGCWEKTVKGIKNAAEREELFVCLASTITKYNYHEVPELIKLAERLGVKRFLAFNFIPTGKAVDIQEADITPQMREELLQTLYNYMKQGSIEAMTTAPQFARVCMSKSKDTVAMAHFGTGTTSEKTRLLAEFIGGCGAGRLYCALQPNGVLTPCVYMPIEIGNLREEEFQELWENSQVLRELREREHLLGNCGRCNFKNVCGGCRARAYAYTGSISGFDPGCIRNLHTTACTPTAAEHRV